MARTPKPWFWTARRSWCVTIDGSRIVLGRDKQEAIVHFHQIMARPQRRRVASQSVAALADAFLDWAQKNRSADTYEWYRYRLERFVQRYPDLLADELRPYHVQTWVDSYDLSKTSRRNYLRSVKRCMRWARQQGYIDINPLADLEIPVGERREAVISPVEFDSLLSYVRNRSLEDLITVTWESGCRPQESLRVEARHVDLANQRWVFPKTESKMKRVVRTVYLTDKAMAITRRLMLTHPEGALFRNVDGKPWTTEAVNCAFKAIRQRIGKDEIKRRGETIPEKAISALIPKLCPTRTSQGKKILKNAAELRCEAKRKQTFRRAIELAPRYSLYALRHSWATNALQNGVDPLTVAILMGHQDPSTLAKVYQHLSLNPAHMLQQARRAVG